MNFSILYRYRLFSFFILKQFLILCSAFLWFSFYYLSFNSNQLKLVNQNCWKTEEERESFERSSRRVVVVLLHNSCRPSGRSKDCAFLHLFCRRRSCTLLSPSIRILLLSIRRFCRHPLIFSVSPFVYFVRPFVLTVHLLCRPQSPPRCAPSHTAWILIKCRWNNLTFNFLDHCTFFV